MGDGLDVADLLADATAATGLDDFGDEWFLTPLELWSIDLRGDHLTDVGRRLFRSQAVRDLSRRLRVLQTLRTTPEIAEVDIPPIVYITGLERSGTTLLHNLIASHSSARALARWELVEPVPPPESATAATDPRIETVQSAVDRLRGSLLERMHWVNADEPEECTWGLIDCVSFLIVPDRDPYRCVVSTEVMLRSIAEPLVVAGSAPGFDAADAAGRKLDAITSFEQSQPGRVVHLSYPLLIADPVGGAARVFDAVDIPADPLIEQRIGDFLAAQQAGKRATPPCELDAFGLEHDEFLARPVIADYCRRNGIQPEVIRLTG